VAAPDVFGKKLGNSEYYVMIAGQQLGTHYGEPGMPRGRNRASVLKLRAF